MKAVEKEYFKDKVGANQNGFISSVHVVARDEIAPPDKTAK